MPRLDWLELFQEPLDYWGFALYIVVFPIYHGIYPIVLMRLFPRQAARTRFDSFRTSWIEGILERKDYLLAAQQTRNLTMVVIVVSVIVGVVLGVVDFGFNRILENVLLR